MNVPIPSLRLPSRRGLLFIGGVGALSVVGVLEAPVAVALGAVPLVMANLGDGSGGARTSRPSRGTGTPRQSTARRASGSSARSGTTRRRSGTRSRRATSGEGAASAGS